jgi:hypothetical protein
MIENNIVIQWRSFPTRLNEMNDQFFGFRNHDKLPSIESAHTKIVPKAAQVAWRLVEVPRGIVIGTEELSEVIGHEL